MRVEVSSLSHSYRISPLSLSKELARTVQQDLKKRQREKVKDYPRKQKKKGLLSSRRLKGRSSIREKGPEREKMILLKGKRVQKKRKLSAKDEEADAYLPEAEVMPARRAGQGKEKGRPGLRKEGDVRKEG